MQRREMLGTVMGALGAMGVMGAGAGDARAATQWKLATGYKPETLHTQNIEQFARDVEKATAGDLKIAVHPNNSLVKLPEILGAVQSGKAEAGEMLMSAMVKDVPLAQTPDTLRMQPWDRDRIHRLFDDLEFRVLRDRLFDTLASADPEVDEGFDVRGGALEPGSVAAWLAEHVADGRRAGIAVVGTHLAFDGDATALAVAAADGDGCYIDTAILTPEDEAALGQWLADAGKPKAVHEAKLAMHDLAGRGWTLAGVTSDTALAAYLVRPGQRSFALDDLSLRYLRRELRADTPEQQQLSLLDDEEGVDDQAVQTLILRARAVAVYLMTGTPVPTHLEDVYGIIRLINPGAYGNKAAFERQHCEIQTFKVQNGKKEVKVKKVVGYVNTEKVYQALYKNARRVQKRDVIQMPDPLITQIKVHLSGAHKKLYKKIINDRFAILGDKVLMPDNQSALRHLALQLISCPDEFDPNVSMDNDLAKACDTLLDSINPDQHKVIIFAYYKRAIDFLAKRYSHWNPAVLYGGSDRGQVEKFKTDPSCRIFVINWIAGGAGLNLQCASHSIFYECPTSPKDAKQAIARTDRKGQENIVNVYFLRVMGTLLDRNFKNLLKNEEENNQIVRDRKDLLHELLH